MPVSRSWKLPGMRTEIKQEESRMTYKEYNEVERRKFSGKAVKYCGEVHTVADVDYNGQLLIDKPAQFTETTAVSRFDKNLKFI